MTNMTKMTNKKATKVANKQHDSTFALIKI